MKREDRYLNDLYNSIKTNNFKRSKKLINQDFPNFKKAVVNGDTLLSLARKKGDSKIINLLVKKGYKNFKKPSIYEFEILMTPDENCDIDFNKLTKIVLDGFKLNFKSRYIYNDEEIDILDIWVDSWEKSKFFDMSWSWTRQSDIKYKKFIGTMIKSLDFLIENNVNVDYILFKIFKSGYYGTHLCDIVVSTAKYLINKKIDFNFNLKDSEGKNSLYYFKDDPEKLYARGLRFTSTDYRGFCIFDYFETLNTKIII